MLSRSPWLRLNDGFFSRMKSCCLLLVLLGTLPLFAEEMKWLDDAVIQKAKQAVVWLTLRETQAGIGFFASDDGLVVTSAGLCEGVSEVGVLTNGGEEIRGCRVVAMDPESDLAVLETGKKPTHYLKVQAKPAAAGELCALFYMSEWRKISAADGKLLARREGLNRKDARFVDLWSVGMSPNLKGPGGYLVQPSGAPVITRDGHVAGMCGFMRMTGEPSKQKFMFAIPEAAIASLLDTFRSSKQSLNSVTLAGATDPDYMEGVKLLNSGELPAAIEKFKLAAQRNPTDAGVMTVLAGALVNSGHAAEAREVIGAILKLEPAHVRARIGMGVVISTLDGETKAIDYFQRLTTEFPKLGEAWELLAKLYNRNGRKEEALAARKKHAELEPDSMNAWDACYEAFAAVGDYAGAGKAREQFNDLESLFFKLTYSAPKRN